VNGDTPGPKDGIRIKHLHDMGKERRAIKTIKHKHRIIRSRGSDTVIEEHEYEYEVWDKMTALKLLAEYHRIIGGRKAEEGDGESRVLVYLPDNGFGGGPVKMKEVKEGEFEEVKNPLGIAAQ